MEITKESCLKVPMIIDKINQEKKLSNFINTNIKEYKKDELMLQKKREVYNSYLNTTIGKKEKSVDKQYYLDKFEVKKKEINSMFKDLETEYDKKIDFLVKNSSTNKTNNFMDKKIFSAENKLKNIFHKESSILRELNEEKEKKEKLLQSKKNEVNNLNFLMYNVNSRMNSGLTVRKECEYENNTINCPPDNYNTFVLFVILNIVTLVCHYFFLRE